MASTSSQPEPELPPVRPTLYTRCKRLVHDVWLSTDLLFQSKLTWLLLFGPFAIFGNITHIFGEALCFACAGLALIPCAERLSFVTEQVAAHTNGTIGALLNATFGNAPELLLSTAALRSHLYRFVQLAMLGSMLTNLLFVFGLSCVVGGFRWQVQELRITSGNVSVMMLLVATAGSFLPAALELSGQMKSGEAPTSNDVKEPSRDELHFCRVNAALMMILYMCYLLFQLGTHKEEFDEEENVVETPEHLLLMTPHFTSRHGRKKRSDRNLFCSRIFCPRENHQQQQHHPVRSFELPRRKADVSEDEARGLFTDHSSLSSSDSKESHGSNNSCSNGALDKNGPNWTETNTETSSLPGREKSSSRRRHRKRPKSKTVNGGEDKQMTLEVPLTPTRMFQRNKAYQRAPINEEEAEEDEEAAVPPSTEEPVMSFWVGIVWLIIITLCISAMSDILVDTIHGFAGRSQLSEVFTTMVIIPFFSNVAEQVSAILFAYRNEMDLCVGVTVGSAIQVATFVLPGCVIIGMMVDRSMTLYFRGYETCCLFLSVICVAAVLQGGTTNWLVGATLMGIYFMMAAGFWFHEIEEISKDAEELLHNATRT